MSGQYAQQTAADSMTPGHIPNYVRFIPEYLKPLGYRSYHTGKWHLKHVRLSLLSIAANRYRGR